MSDKSQIKEDEVLRRLLKMPPEPFTPKTKKKSPPTETKEKVIELPPEEKPKNTKISEKDMKEIFKLFDKEKNLTMASKDIPDFIRCQTIYLSDEEMQKLTEIANPSKTEYVPFDDIAKMMEHVDRDKSSNDIAEAFKILDKDGDGFLSNEDLKFIWQYLGDEYTEEEADEIVKLCDVQKRGKVDFADFCRVFND